MQPVAADDAARVLREENLVDPRRAALASLYHDSDFSADSDSDRDESDDEAEDEHGLDAWRSGAGVESDEEQVGPAPGNTPAAFMFCSTLSTVRCDLWRGPTTRLWIGR